LIFRVYLHESVPELIRVTTITAISLVGLTPMAGAGSPFRRGRPPPLPPDHNRSRNQQ